MQVLILVSGHDSVCYSSLLNHKQYPILLTVHMRSHTSVHDDCDVATSTDRDITLKTSQ